ncbi:MAG: hypothetical protein V4561_03890 [Bacteroidota bacterium]
MPRSDVHYISARGGGTTVARHEAKQSGKTVGYLITSIKIKAKGSKKTNLEK